MAPRPDVPVLPSRELLHPALVQARWCILLASEQRGVETPVELSERPLEAELAEIAERAEPGRTAQFAVRHWGWDGRGGATLKVTGRELGGITRERVRQLCERLSLRLRDEHAPAPALERSLVLAAHAAPTTANDLARRLADERIASRPLAGSI